MGKHHKKDKKDKKNERAKKLTGRQREQKRKIMKLAKLFKNKDDDDSASSSSSSSSSPDVDPRQNSQIRRNIRRRALRMAAEALNEQYGLGLNSASSSDTWANKAASLAKALGTVAPSPPPAKAKAMTVPPPPPPPHVIEGNQLAAEQTQQGFSISTYASNASITICYSCNVCSTTTSSTACASCTTGRRIDSQAST